VIVGLDHTVLSFETCTYAIPYADCRLERQVTVKASTNDAVVT